MSYANAPIVLNVRDLTAGQYNNAQFNAKNQNIIQGDIREVAVSEVNFPYDIPNIQAGFNTFQLDNLSLVTPVKGIITIEPGFYTGPELATAVTNKIIAFGATQAVPINPANLPTLSYNTTTNIFTFLAPTAYIGDYSTWYISSPYLYPTGLGSPLTTTLGKDIMTIMGFQSGQDPLIVVDNPPSPPPGQGNLNFVAGGAAPLAFTQYIDICSPKMCQYQYFRDGSTTNLARRADVICRLFICDNVSLTQTAVEGTRPFIINRQYINARIMRWSAENSVGTIDIQLYDDVGQPLTTTWVPRPYQITFNCYERSMEGDKERDEMVDANGKPPPKYASYHERNVSQAWEQLSRQGKKSTR